MESKVKIEQIHNIDEHLEQLSELLIGVVENGASIGFLPPMKKEEATNYWKTILSSEVIFLVAKLDSQIVGCVQIHLSQKQNGTHRAEIGKLMTHPDFRRLGVGRLLMQKAEDNALLENRTLIVLDTREGDPSNKLYSSLGYIQGGRIPNYAKSANGELEATIIYYKNIE